MNSGPISSTFLREATNAPSSTFLYEATGLSICPNKIVTEPGIDSSKLVLPKC
jgi:hypothetical protein